MKNNKRENETYAGKEVTVEDYYRNLIIEMVKSIENQDTLVSIYSFTMGMLSIKRSRR